ncbi:uncharacterized protein LOC144146028 [Haemaphysalis longicornis]
MAAPKRYGLILPKKGDKPTLSQTSVFGDDSDDEHDKAAIERTMRKESMRNLKKMQTQLMLQKAMAEDPSVFEYDEVYDDMKKTKEEKKQEVTKDKKPRYIEQLLKAAELRKREGDRRTQRQIQREREAEGEAFGDKEAYVTAAYKRKMQEMQEEEEREARRDQIDAMMDVTKQKDLSGFYRHLLKQEVGEERIPQNTDKPMEVPEVTIKQEAPESSEDRPSTSRHNASPSVDSTSRSKSEKSRDNVPRQGRRGYRTRKISDPSEDEDVAHQAEPSMSAEPSTSANIDRDLDADSDFEVDSGDSSDEKEDRASAKGKQKLSTKSRSSSSESGDEPETTAAVDKKEDAAREAPTKVVVKDWQALFQKRTVGDKLDEAVARYFERKATLDAHRAAHGTVQ